MSDRIDRSMGNHGSLLAMIAVIFVIAIGIGSYVWLRMTDEPASTVMAPSSPSYIPLADDTLSITIFIPGDRSLSSGSVAVKRQSDAQAQAREALITVLAHMLTVQSPVLKELKLRQMFLDETGTAYVDLSLLPDGGIKASAWEELLALYALTNTLIQNFEEIKQVRFLVDGKEAQTLAGHLDLSKTYKKRVDLVKQ